MRRFGIGPKAWIALTLLLAFALPSALQAADRSSYRFDFRIAIGFWQQERFNLIKDYVRQKLQPMFPNVNFDLTMAVGTQEHLQAMKLAFDAQNGPDLVHGDNKLMSTLFDGNFIMDLTSLAKQKGWWGKIGESDRTMFTYLYKNRLYGIPELNTFWVGCYYNKKIFNELGIQPPRTIQEFEAACDKMKKAGYIPLEADGQNAAVLLWYMYSMLSNDVPLADVLKWYFREGSTDAMKAGWIRTFTRLNDWLRKGYFRDNLTSIDLSTIETLFAKGQSGILLNGTWESQNIEKLNMSIGYFPFPKLRPDHKEYFSVGLAEYGYCFNKAIENDPQKLDVASAYIDMIYNTPDFYQDMYRKAGTLTKYPIDTKTPEKQPDSKLLSMVAAAHQNTQAMYFLDNVFPGFYEIMTKITQRMILGQITPVQFYDAMQSEYDRLNK